MKIPDGPYPTLYGWYHEDRHKNRDGDDENEDDYDDDEYDR